jgi:hypothetical protein
VYSLLNIIGTVKPKRMKLAAHSAQSEEIIYVYRIIVGAKQLETFRVDEKNLWKRKLNI